MNRTDARAGMQVVFGRPGEYAEKSLGVIEKVNPTRAKVKLTEQRGRIKSHAVGSVWTVPYELMEPAPADGDKAAVKIAGRSRPDDASVAVGTTFRSCYADGNPLWKVLSKRGRDSWLCEITNEPIVIDGKEYGSDFAGTQKLFMTSEITRSIGLSNLFKGYATQHEDFYASLKPGQTVHYNHGFDKWVRCTVVVDGGDNKLKPIALVGNWKSYDLPQRMNDGSVHNGYHADKILNGELMTPNSSMIFDGGSKPRNGIDPTTLTPIDLSVPPMTADEAVQAHKWLKVQDIHKITAQHDGDPQAILDAVMESL